MSYSAIRRAIRRIFRPSLFMVGLISILYVPRSSLGIIKTLKKSIMNTCGVALLQMPFFLIAHAYCKFSGGQADGFSPMYMSLLDLSTILYVAFGFFLLFLALKNHFHKPNLLFAFFCSLFWEQFVLLYSH